jgi:CheY-like chemotaxis protein
MKLSRIVTIDDDEIDSLIFEKVIKHISSDTVVHRFGDCLSAMNALEKMMNADIENFPQLIILDIFMPGMDGWKFLDKYEQLIQQRAISTIVYLCTNSNNINDWIRARDHKLVENVILKPFAHRTFIQLKDKHFEN